MAFVDVEGGRLHVREMGDGPRTVVLVHGLFANMAQWYFSLAPALARTYRVVLYDLRGHGLSSRTTSGYGVRAMSRDLDAVVRSATSGPVSLVGFSYGSVIAFRYACDHPGEVDDLVAIEPPLPMDLASLDEWVRSLTSPAELIDQLPRPQQAAALGRPRSSRLVRGVIELVSGTDLAEEIDAEPDITDGELRTITARTLLCYGLDSPVREANGGRRLRDALPGVREVVLPGGHFVPNSSAERLEEVITRFLGGHDLGDKVAASG